jgi:hypothetical protein
VFDFSLNDAGIQKLDNLDRGAAGKSITRHRIELYIKICLLQVRCRGTQL